MREFSETSETKKPEIKRESNPVEFVKEFDTLFRMSKAFSPEENLKTFSELCEKYNCDKSHLNEQQRAKIESIQAEKDNKDKLEWINQAKKDMRKEIKEFGLDYENPHNGIVDETLTRALNTGILRSGLRSTPIHDDLHKSIYGFDMSDILKEIYKERTGKDYVTPDPLRQTINDLHQPDDVAISVKDDQIYFKFSENVAEATIKMASSSGKAGIYQNLDFSDVPREFKIPAAGRTQNNRGLDITIIPSSGGKPAVLNFHTENGRFISGKAPEL